MLSSVVWQEIIMMSRELRKKLHRTRRDFFLVWCYHTAIAFSTLLWCTLVNMGTVKKYFSSFSCAIINPFWYQRRVFSTYDQNFVSEKRREHQEHFSWALCYESVEVRSLFWVIPHRPTKPVLLDSKGYYDWKLNI